MMTIGVISAIAILLYILFKNVFGKPIENSQIQIGTRGLVIINKNGNVKIKGPVLSLEVNGTHVVV